MEIYKEFILKHSIEIMVPSEKLWDFFYNIENNYILWHPKDHIQFKWKKGNPLEVGSTIYSEQTMGGETGKLKGVCSEIIPYRKIAFNFDFPTSFMCPRIEWLIEPKGKNSIFTALTYYRFGKLFLRLNKDKVDHILETTEEHMKEEGKNLKRILENL
ncbi:MAG TPA: SRPBCC family protein [Methanofastidiosum sp.]|nr:SRPBCC family protein [Methanofastidiosum sp.]HQK62401.1 SRPBCC family protein [Methanofastidiosum sp.]HQM94648.1 SRPBCC family protein [Methanofastidiosum sp.]HQQ48647.1 SRPBCC family protein [Methanofastidiosum sp.]